MTLPWAPVILLDIVGSLSILVIAVVTFYHSSRWSRQDPDDFFRHYLFLLTLSILFFALSRSVGHLVKQALILSGHRGTWAHIAAYSGAINSAAFVVIAGFSFFFHRFQKTQSEIEQYQDHLEDLITMRTIELTAATKRLENEQERLAVTLGSIADGVIATDLEGSVVLMNRVTEQLTGWTLKEAKGRSIDAVVTILCKESGERCPNPVESILEGIAPQNFELRGKVLISRDGTRTTIEESGAPIFDRQGSIIGTVMVLRDISERERGFNALLRLEKLESVEILAGGIAHDFRNLLSAILGNIQLAQLALPESGDTIQLLKSATSGALRARALTEQLLTFASGGSPLKRRTSIQQTIHDSASFMLYGSSVRCHYALPDDLWRCEVDAVQLGQVIQNLVINARQAMPDGGEISIACDNVEGVPELQREGPHVRITVRDQGGGIPEANLHRIFDPYFTTKSEGSGLGLALSVSIIRNHGGEILVESEQGVGTTFTLLLPALRSQEEPVAASTPIPAPTGERPSPASVLIMDDEEIILRVSGQMLQALGHHPDLAVSGSQALELYTTRYKAGNPIDVVILDVNVPNGMGGVETAAAIHAFDPRAKIVLCSGYYQESFERGPLPKGVSATLTKPFLMESLKRTLLELL